MSASKHNAGIASTSGAIGTVTAIAFLLRILDLDHNGPFTDEWFCTIAIEYGNTSVATGNVYLWPAVSYGVYSLGGIEAVRAVAAVLSALTAAFVYKFSEVLAPHFTSDGAAGTVPFFSALIYAFSAPSLFVGAHGSWDAQAFMLFTFGFWQLAAGIESGKPSRLVLGAATFALASITRYMLFMVIPVAVVYAGYAGFLHPGTAPRPGGRKASHSLILGLKSPVSRFFLMPLAALVGGYWLFFHRQILATVVSVEFLLHRLQSIQTSGFVVARTLEILIPVFAVMILAGTALALATATAKRTIRPAIHAGFLLGSTALVVGYHVFVLRCDFTLHKNLNLAALFGAVLAAVALNRIERALAGFRMLRYAVPGLICLALLIPAIRIVDDHQGCWPDLRGAVTAACRSQLNQTEEIWTTYGPLGWGLRREMGRAVDTVSGFRSETPEAIVVYAALEAIPVVVGPVPGRNLRPGDTLLDYKVRDVAEVSGWPAWSKSYVLEYVAGYSCTATSAPETAGIGQLPFSNSRALESLFILPASCLPASPCRISEIAFVPAETKRIWEAERFEVRMTHTTLGTAGDGASIADVLGPCPILVRDGSLRWEATKGEWSPIGLKRSFGYDATRNLAVHIRWRRKDTGHGVPVLQTRDVISRSPARSQKPAPGGPRTRITSRKACTLLCRNDRVRPGTTTEIRFLHGPPGDWYQMAASLGQSPQRMGRHALYLDPDGLFTASVFWGPPLFTSYTGKIDRTGKATATLYVPDLQALVGIGIYHAAVTFNHRLGITSCTNTVGLEVIRR